MKKFFAMFIMMATVMLSGCSKDDEPDMGGDSGADKSITINVNGTTSNGASFIPIDESTFYIDYVKYQIVDSHLEIVGYDKTELKPDVTIYSPVNYNGISYNVRKIVPDAFSGSQMKTVRIPSSISYIDYRVFAESKVLEAIYLTNSITRIGISAFSGCTSLKTIDLSSIEYIGASAFSGCAALEAVNLPSAITRIEEGTFSGCSSLKAIDLSSIEYIGEWAFSRCAALETVSLPSAITRIERGTFSGCSSLKNIDLSLIEYIGAYAFSGCTAMETVNLPEAITKIEDGTFEKCSSLKEIDLASITYIGSCAFDESGLENVIWGDRFGDKIEFIGENAFGKTKITTLELSRFLNIYWTGMYYSYESYSSAFNGMDKLEHVMCKDWRYSDLLFMSESNILFGSQNRFITLHVNKYYMNSFKDISDWGYKDVVFDL